MVEKDRLELELTPTFHEIEYFRLVGRLTSNDSVMFRSKKDKTDTKNRTIFPLLKN